MIRRLVSVGWLCLALSAPALANKSGANWYFGYNGGLTFINGTPEPLPGGRLSTVEGCATISDIDGNLLFYTDGITVWNRDHQVMPNGTGLKGDSSATQSAVIVPHPGDANLYYIFTAPAYLLTGLNYTLVDMTLDGGKGDVDVNHKNVQIMETSTEHLTAVGAAGGGFWVIGRPGNGVAGYHAFRVDADGLDMTPVISTLGFEHNDTEIGHLKSTSQGDKLAACFYFSGKTELYDFDNSTGVVSNARVVGMHADWDVYGLEFSQDGTKLYVSLFGSSKILQYDLAAVDIAASETIVNTGGFPAALQLGPDGKIYVAQYQATSLGVIHSPNTTGTDCNYEANAVSIAGMSTLGLPTFIQSFFSSVTLPSVVTSDPLAVTTTGAEVTCSVLDNGGESLTEAGVCWNTTGSPTIADSKDGTNDDVSSVPVTITDLTPGTTYYVRAFATNSAGTVYGEEKSFTTLPDADGDGVTDVEDGCPEDTLKTELGSCGCGIADTDTDSDGTPDCEDACPDDADKTEAGACGCGVADADSDGDGTPDCVDNCPDDALKTGPGSCGCGIADTDTDSDGTPDCEDGCPDDADKTETGACGCGVADADSDGDGTPDCLDGCPENPDLTEAGPEGCSPSSPTTPTTPTTPSTPTTPQLEVTVHSDQESAGVGEQVGFTVYITNKGNGSATGVTVTIPLPPNSQFISARLNPVASGQTAPGDVQMVDGNVIIHIGELPPDQAVQVELVLKALVGGQLLLSSTVQSDQAAEPAVGFNEVVLSVQDQYVEVITRTTPVPCGGTGGMPLMAAAACLGLWSSRRRSV